MTRAAIIAALRDGERPVTDIVKAVELERSNASRHLSGMKAAGIVARRVDERMQAHYRLANDYTLIDCGFDPPSGGARCEEQAGGAARWYSGRKFYMNAAQHQDGNGRPAPRVGLFFRLFLSV
ncbi:ArsR/SmtB family transcription factor [Citrifermentans bremense]|uniref:ArsR/SmtB family transcription factor n=1 Tax=Citrifermentans bremense TaxID=60035 RepID=UPI0005582681|nr:metalloregulator ArsR/SmtB family transcription factor [Citrifermentans bremense]